MELTGAEKKLLSGISFNSEAIENGELDEKDLTILQEMRAVDAHLRKKYPSYCFEITGCEPMEGTVKEYDEWYYVWTLPGDCGCKDVEKKAEDVTSSALIARAVPANGSFTVTDDFYGEIIRPAITAKITEAATECGFTVVQTNIGFWEYFGDKYDENISPEDVLTGKIHAGNDIKIFLDGSSLKQPSHEAAVADLEKCLKSKGVKGDVYAVFLKSADGDIARDRVYSDSFTLE